MTGVQTCALPIYDTQNTSDSQYRQSGYKHCFGRNPPLRYCTFRSESVGGFQVLRPELPDANILNVIPQQDYGSATLVVTLAGQDVPLVIALEADSIKAPSRQADAMVLFQFAHHGPKAKIPVIKDIQETVTSDMLAILDHVPPKEAVRLRTEPQDENLEIWKIGSMHYLRTRHDLMWPAWTASVNGAGEVKCYELPQTPRLIVSRQGIVSTVKIKEAGGDDNQK